MEALVKNSITTFSIRARKITRPLENAWELSAMRGVRWLLWAVLPCNRSKLTDVRSELPTNFPGRFSARAHVVVNQTMNGCMRIRTEHDDVFRIIRSVPRQRDDVVPVRNVGGGRVRRYAHAPLAQRITPDELAHWPMSGWTGRSPILMTWRAIASGDSNPLPSSQ